MSEKNGYVLLFEDDLDEVELFSDNFSKLACTCTLRHAENGIEGIELLKEMVTINSLPCLIILDINMPRLNGKDTALFLKQNASFQHIPVVVFTTSTNPEDIAYFKTLSIPYFNKPTRFTDYRTQIERMLAFANTGS